MARIVPSMVVQAIERTYDWARRAADGERGQSATLGPEHAPHVGMIVALASELPAELHPSSAEEFAQFTAALGALRAALAAWTSGGHPAHTFQLAPWTAFGGDNAIVALLKVLRALPDEAPPHATAGLSFVTDEGARADLRNDMSTAHRAFGNAEFKAATVLAGASTEALLLWAIKSRPDTDLDAALARVTARCNSEKRRAPHKGGIERWHLSEFNEIALEMAIIDYATFESVRLSNDFRNLIHPGRALRSGETCSPATALMALGAMERVVERLTRAA